MSSVVVFVLGVACFQLMPELPSPAWLWVLIPVLLCWRTCVRFRLPLALMLGFGWGFSHALITRPASLPEAFLGTDVQAHGQIIGLPQRKGDGARFLFRVHALARDGQVLEGNWTFRIGWYRAAPELRAGERWRLPLRLKKVVAYRNPGSFDYAGWLYAKGVRYSGHVRGEGQLIESAHWGLDRLRQRISSGLDPPGASPRSVAVMRALAVGDRSGLTSEERDLFAATGTSHLMAISGLHVGLITGLVFLMARFLWSRLPRLCARWPAPVAAAVPAMAAGVGYAALAGFTLPTQRALVMLLVAMGALLSRRHIRPWRGLSVALLAVVLWDPMALLSAGFWLSFVAVAMILWFSGQNRIRGRWWWLQLAISLGTMPVLAWQQMELSLISPLVNLVVIPLFSLLIVPGTLAGVMLEAVWEWPGQWLLREVALLIEGTLGILDGIADWNPRLSGREPLLWLALASLAALVVWRRGERPRVVGLAAGLFLLIILVFRMDSGRIGPHRFELELLDVGQGLSAVVRTANHVLVFDTGPRFSSGFNTGSAVLRPYLSSLGVSQIDKLLLSHGDLDHVGGARDLVEGMRVEEILAGEPGRLQMMPEAKRCQAGEQWWWDGVHFTILWPPRGTLPDGNNSSCVLRISTGEKALLLTGDIEGRVERQLVEKQNRYLASAVVVAPHHGSNSSSTGPFIEVTEPRYVLFSAGAGNRWGFPRQEVLGRWCKGGALPLSTAAEGSIRFRFGPSSLSGPRLHGRRHKRYWQWQMEQQIPPSCSMIAASEYRG